MTLLNYICEEVATECDTNLHHGLHSLFYDEKESQYVSIICVFVELQKERVCQKLCKYTDSA